MASPLSKLNEVHIEITNLCNLKCKYCYAETVLPGKAMRSKLFTSELYRKTVRELFEATSSPFIDLVFHGGEPLLHTPKWFGEACAYAQETAKELGKDVHFSMQSNLTLLRDEHLEVFKRFRVSVGVSLDGDKKTHNAMRGNFERTRRNIKRLQEAELFGGVIIVASHHNYDRIPDFVELMLELGLPTFHLNIASSVGRGDGIEPLGTEKTWRAWKDCIDAMLTLKGRVIDTRLIKKISQYLRPPPSVEATLADMRCDNIFCHAGVTMVAVQQNGDVFPCGCAGSSGNIKSFRLTNMAEDTWDAEHWFGTLARFHAKTDKYQNECLQCPARYVCEHGCPAFDHTDPVTPQNTCRATKQLYEYLEGLDRAALETLVTDHEAAGLEV